MQTRKLHHPSSTLNLRGDSFKIVLPALREIMPSDATEAGSILVVDNNPHTLSRYKGLCEKLGLNVSTATSVPEAKQAIQNKEFDVILTDLDYSGKTFAIEGKLGGLQLVRWCKEQGVESKLILHSTMFDFVPMAILGSPVKNAAERSGAIVAGKNSTRAIFERLIAERTH